MSAASRAVQIYFFNTRENGEQMWNRVDEPTDMDAIELQMNFNYPVANDFVCVVSALSQGMVTISPSGRVEKH